MFKEIAKYINCKIFLFCVLLTNIPLFVYAQSSGGQIVRSKPVTSTNNTHRIIRNNTYAKDGSYNGYDYVDLGLSVKWATCNVGAQSLKDFGFYFAWGEIVAKTDYGSISQNRIRRDLGTDISGTVYDAAKAKLGGNWRMPTKGEVQELIDRCKWKPAKYKGVDGFCITGPNNKSIFIPAAGSYIEKEKSLGYYVDMWTSNAEIEGRLCWVYHLHIDNNIHQNPPVQPELIRESYYVGMCVRPVIN